MDEFAALVAEVLKNLDGAGVLADWLQEHGREREAVLLRRRWKRWRSDRVAPHYWRDWDHSAGVEDDELMPVERTRSGEWVKVHEDRTFRDYVGERFGAVRLEDVTHWCVDGWSGGSWGHVVVRAGDGIVYTACGSMIFGGDATTERPRGVCKKCRRSPPKLRPASATDHS